MIGYYFIQNKYIFVGNKDKEKDINGNDKYTKELTAQLAQKDQQAPMVHPVPPAAPQAPQAQQAQQAQQAPLVSSIKESFDTEEDENENLIHNNKNKRTNISMTYKKLLNYIF
ncbi:MAG: hypothetical protein ACOVNU_07890 [Candidatus Kapaibacteriota bacterium]